MSIFPFNKNDKKLGLQQLLIYISKNTNAQLHLSFVLNNPRVIAWLLGAIDRKLNCSGKGSNCRKEGWR